MALRAEIIGSDPGRAQLRLHGVTPEAGSLRIQIRRNQGPDYTLGDAGRWQSAPDFWFTIADTDRTSSADGIDIAIGPEIVDPIAASLGGNAFQVTIETPTGTASAPLVIPQHPILLASGAAGAPQHPAPEPSAAPAPPPPSPPAPPPPPRTLKADPRNAPIEKSGGRFGLIAGVLVVVILALAIAGYFLRDRVTALMDGTVGPAQPAAEPQTSELDQIKTFLAQNPDAAQRSAKAKETLAACQLNWASTLYRDLGQAGDVEAALAMGRLYDPTDPVCPAVGAPNRSLSSDTAGFWYDKAVAGKSVEAMRRKGLMLVAAGKDAPKFQEGIDLLKQASSQGDADAAAKLKELGQ
jgi:hypothetical protein